MKCRRMILVNTCDTCDLLITLPKTNIALENRPSQKESLPTIHFQVRTVSFREVKANVYPLFPTFFLHFKNAFVFFPSGWHSMWLWRRWVVSDLNCLAWDPQYDILAFVLLRNFGLHLKSCWEFAHVKKPLEISEPFSLFLVTGLSVLLAGTR